MARVSRLLIAGLIVTSLGMVLHIIGLVSTEWLTTSLFFLEAGRDLDITLGLFRECVGDDCANIPDPSGVQKAAQAFGIMACLVGPAGIAIAAVYTFLVVRGQSPMVIFRRIGACCCFVAKVFIIICLIMFRVKVYQDYVFKGESRLDLSLGNGFACSSLGGVGYLVGGILIIVARGYEAERFTS